MAPALIALGGVSLFEVSIWLPALWRWRRPLAISAICLLAISAGLLLGWSLNVLSVLLVTLSIYRALNLLRLVEGRMQADYLFHAARRTSLWLLGIQAVTVILA